MNSVLIVIRIPVNELDKANLKDISLELIFINSMDARDVVLP